MLKLEHTKDEFKIYYKDHLFLNHNPNKPCLIIGIGKAQYQMNKHRFKIRDKVEASIELNEFKIISNTNKEIIISFSGKNNVLDLICREKDDYLEIIPKSQNPNINRFWISISATHEENIYGCGSQFSELNLRGKIHIKI